MRHKLLKELVGQWNNDFKTSQRSSMGALGGTNQKASVLDAAGSVLGRSKRRPNAPRTIAASLSGWLEQQRC